MKSGMKKAIALLLMLSLMMTSITTTFAQISDYKGHWAEKKIEKLMASGVIARNNGLARPNDKITKTELVIMLNNLFGYSLNAKDNFKDVPVNAWYADVLSKAKGEGIIFGGANNLFCPNSRISRQDAVTIIARAFKLSSDSKSYLKFKDAAGIAAYAQSAFSALIDRNVLVGGGGLVRPTGEITRAEVFSIICGLYDQLYNKPGVYENRQVLGNAIINKPGITLKNVVVSGDLYLAPGIGEGDVYLDNVQVKGRTVVSGGGQNSAHAINSSLQVVLFDRRGGGVRFVAEGSTTVAHAILQSSASLEEKNLTGGSTGFGSVTVDKASSGQIAATFAGTFNNIAVNGTAQVTLASGSVGTLSLSDSARNSIVQVAGASVDNFLVEAPAQIQAQDGASISSMTLNAGVALNVSARALIGAVNVGETAQGTSITGTGTIRNIDVRASGVTVNNRPVAYGTNTGVGNAPASGGSNNPPAPEPASFTYTINYYRYDGRARSWDMWIWANGAEGSEYEFSQTTQDGFAKAVLTLPKRTMNIIIRPGSWSSQEVTRVMQVPSGQSSVEVWIVQDVADVYYSRNQVDVSPKVTGAMMDSAGEIMVSLTHPLNPGDIDSFKLIDRTTNAQIAVTPSEIPGNPNRARLAIQDPSKIDVRGWYQVYSDRFSPRDVTMRRVLDSPQYFYAGNDLGLTYSPSGSTFKVWAPTAKKVSLSIYATPGTYNESGVVTDHAGGQESPMTRSSCGVWSIYKEGDLAGKFYMYKVEFANGVVNYAVDPYARAVSANGQRTAIIDLDATDPQGWDPGSKPATIVNNTDSIIYELHIRDFSIDKDAPFINKGKYLAFTETGLADAQGNPVGIDHIADLGITTVHLLPPYDAGSVNELKVDDPNYTGRKYNWGYDPVNYNVPEGIYSSNPADPKTRITEFKQMVQALHDKGIRVVMDVVYNHTYETGITPNSRFDPIVPGYFYRISDDNRYSNGSGCSNDIATERPMVRKYIVDSVKYWAQEYNLDGFRFDLLGLFDLNTARQITSVIKSEVDPTIIIYGEPWQAAATLMDANETPVLDDNRAQRGEEFSFFNDRFRNALKGEPEGTTTGFATGQAAREAAIAAGISGDINDVSLNPREQLNYATAHDNYNLWDKILISTGLKNGNANRNAVSFTDPYAGIVDENDPFASTAVKQSILTNSILLLAQGMPFFPAGDEFLRSKLGVADSYASPDSVNQITWSNLGMFSEVSRYYKGLISLRRAHPAFRMAMRQDVLDHQTFFVQTGKVVGYQLSGNANGDTWNNIVVIHNANTSATQVTLPANKTWNVVVDESHAGTEILRTFTGGTVTVAGISTMVLYDTASAYTPVAGSIEITPSAVGIEAGSSRVMRAIVRDQHGAVMYGQNLNWTSANTAIATVENGKIVGVSNGQTTVTASLGSVAATVTVNVAELVPQSLSITGDNEVAEGYAAGLSARVHDQYDQEIFNPQVLWESLNPEIAAVNSKGIVTGISEGTAVIRATIGTLSVTRTINVLPYQPRYVEIQYDRPDGNYMGRNGEWDLWTWNTGARDGEHEFTETIDGRRTAFIPVGRTTTRMNFIVRAGGWGPNNQSDREQVDGMDNGERAVDINMNEAYTKVVIYSGVSSAAGMKTYPAAVSRVSGSSIEFRYRDDELFRSNNMDEIDGVKVRVNNVDYDMAYDSANEMFTYTMPITEGKFLYTFLVTKDGATAEVPDIRNRVRENGKSVLEYFVPDIIVAANVSPSSINYGQNALLRLNITSETENVIESIYADLSQIGGGSHVEIDPALNALTIGVAQETALGEKKIPIHVVDRFGNDNVTEASITVAAKTASGDLSFDWDEARIYFAITDRFYDGDTQNNDPNHIGDYNPNHLGCYHGGDLRGLIQKLDYLDDMGINTLWITPIVDNIDQMQDNVHYGYHGYWAKNFELIDEHLGDLDTFKELINAAHDRGIKIMLDVVINHVGYGMGPNDESAPAVPGYPTDADRARYAGLLREQNSASDGVKGGYNFGLPDFITEDPAIRAQVIKLQTDWLARATTDRGDTIDYFRLDTVNNLDLTTLSDFRNALAAINPDFKVVGEAFDATLANSGHLRGTGRLDSVLDFGFNNLAQDFVQNGRISSVEQSLRERNAALNNTATMAQFLSSHDETGFLTNVGNNKGMLKVAASLLITAKGQPVIYYGEEFGNTGRQMNLSDPNNPILSENRKSMPWMTGETGDTDLQLHYKKMMNLRAKYSPIFAKGTRATLAADDSRRLDAFARTYNGETIVVALNASESPQNFTVTNLPFAPGTVLLDEYSNKKYVVSTGGEVAITLPSMAQGGTAVLSAAPSELAIIGASLQNKNITVTFNQQPQIDLSGKIITLTNSENCYDAVYASGSENTAVFTITEPGAPAEGTYGISALNDWVIVDNTLSLRHVDGPAYGMINIDGVIDETDWSLVIDDDKQDNRWGTGGISIDDVCAAWDSQYLYLAVKGDGDRNWHHGLYFLIDANVGASGATIFTADPPNPWGNKHFATTGDSFTIDFEYGGYGDRNGFDAWTYVSDSQRGESVRNAVTVQYGADMANYLELQIPWAQIFHANGGQIPANASIKLAALFISGDGNQPTDVAPNLLPPGNIADDPVIINSFVTVNIDQNGDGQPDKLWQ